MYRTLCLGIVFVACVSASAARAEGPRRILLAGDSWTHFMFFDGTFRDVLDERGFTDVDFMNIALGGTKASQWASPFKLENTRGYLEASPDIDVVFMTLGGNDLMYGEPTSWFENHETPEQEDAFFTWIADNVAAVARNIVETRPNIHVVICGYDYVNAIKKAGNDCSTSPETALIMCNLVNEAMIRCEKKVAQTVSGIERCRFVNNYGVLQHELGYPGSVIPTWLSPWAGECKHAPHWDPTGVDAFRFGPGVVPLPGQLEDNYTPFEGGDPTFKKSPWEAMLFYENQWADLIREYGLDPALLGIDNMGPIDDWIHLSALGHQVVVRHCFDVCIEDWIAQYGYPRVASVERTTMSPVCSIETFSPIGASQVQFKVTFNQPVTGVDEGDFEPVMARGVSGASIASVEELKDGSTYIVAVDTGSGDGTLGLAVRDNDTIQGTDGQPLWGIGHSMNWAPGEAYQVVRGAGVPVVGWPLAGFLLAAGAAALRRRNAA